MHDSIRRVMAVINGDLPDRAPLYDLLRNDAVLEHFSGKRFSADSAREVVYAAYAPALDATRPMVRIPSDERVVPRADGTSERHFRWTSWYPHRAYRDADHYAAVKQSMLAAWDPSSEATARATASPWLRSIADEQASLGEVFFFPSLAGPDLAGIYSEIGFEAFCYFLADCPDVIIAQLDGQCIRAATFAASLPPDHGVAAGFLGDDIAFKAGPLLSPDWFRRHYFPRLASVINAWHSAGIKVLFHSDGNLNPILDDLVEAGIDGLNPIEILAGMDVGEIHRRYPHLFMAGGIDVSQLLPFGRPEQVRDAVRRALEAAEGRLMVGSSTELNNEVPLENYLALRETVLDTRY